MLTRLSVLAAPLLVAALLTPVGSSGQTGGLLLEVGSGQATPGGSFSAGSAEAPGATAGTSLSVAFVFPGIGRRGIYLGFSQHRFGCGGCPADGRYVATGFDAGLRFKIVRAGPATPWVRFGLVTTRVETAGVPGGSPAISDLGFGGEVGAGVHIGSESRIAITPSVRFGAVDSDLPVRSTTLALRYALWHVTASLAF